jgi:simple sugar transport system substrate-binding protein
VRNLKWIVLALVIVGALFAVQTWAADKQIVIYMQCGGTQGDGATLARTNGARAAAAAMNVKLIEQYSKWDQQTMIDQFKQAIAANPDGIEIMNHPGEAAMGPLVDQAEAQGIIVKRQQPNADNRGKVSDQRLRLCRS